MTSAKVLLVDDDPVVRQMLPSYFDDGDLRVAAVVGSATEALEALRGAAFDLVLTDVRMPDMDGVALTRKLQQEAPQRPALTEREEEVLDLVLEGCANTEIAQRLNLSAATVKKHLSSLFRKYDVDSRLKLAVAALRT